jgi:hypothetical protein
MIRFVGTLRHVATMMLPISPMTCAAGGNGNGNWPANCRAVLPGPGVARP